MSGSRDDVSHGDSSTTPPTRVVRLVHAVACPFCRSTDTELLSLFGAQLSTTQYYCRACHTPFEYVKREPQPER